MKKISRHQYAHSSIKLCSRSRIDDTNYILSLDSTKDAEEYVKDRNSEIMNSIASVNNLDLSKKYII